MDEEMRDPDQGAGAHLYPLRWERLGALRRAAGGLRSSPQRVQPIPGHERRPRPVVHRLRLVALIERDIPRNNRSQSAPISGARGVTASIPTLNHPISSPGRGEVSPQATKGAFRRHLR